MSFLQNLFGLSESKKAHEQFYGSEGYRYDQQQPHHKSSFTHELIGGAAGFAAMKAYEDHVRRTGQQVSHPIMKELLAGFAAAEVDKLFETKGLDYLDREKAKRHAVQQAHHLANEQYGQGGTFNWQGDQYGPGTGLYSQQGNQYGSGAGPYPQQGNPYGSGASLYSQQGNPYGPLAGPYPQQGNQYGPGAGPYPQQGNQYGPLAGPYPQQGNQYGPGAGPYPQQGGYGYGGNQFGGGGYQQPPQYGQY